MSTSNQQPQCSRMTTGRTRCTAPATKVFIQRQRMRGGSVGEKRYPRCEAHPLGSADCVEPVAQPQGESVDG